MQVVILAGGKGTRMGELAMDRPKPMIEIAGKNLIQHKLDALPPEISEVVMIVHHMKEFIIDFFGDEYNGLKITYVDQGEPRGTGHALFVARDVLGDEFVSMMGDDIYAPEDIEAVVKYPWALTVAPKKSFKDAWNITADENGFMKELVIDPDGTMDEVFMIDTGLYKMTKDIFNTPLVPLKSKPSEFGLPHTIFEHVQKTGTPLKVLRSTEWYMVNTPQDVETSKQKFEE